MWSRGVVLLKPECRSLATFRLHLIVQVHSLIAIRPFGVEQIDCNIFGLNQAAIACVNCLMSAYIFIALKIVLWFSVINNFNAKKSLIAHYRKRIAKAQSKAGLLKKSWRFFVWWIQYCMVHCGVCVCMCVCVSCIRIRVFDSMNSHARAGRRHIIENQKCRSHQPVKDAKHLF